MTQTYGPLGQITVQGGGAPPKTLNYEVSQGGTNNYIDINDVFGAKVTSGVSSTSLTEVINDPSPGVLTYASLACAGSASLTDFKVKITIDGAVVLDEAAGGALASSQSAAIVGVYANDTTANNAASTEVTIYYNTLIVEIAGDGTNQARFCYKGYST